MSSLSSTNFRGSTFWENLPTANVSSSRIALSLFLITWNCLISSAIPSSRSLAGCTISIIISLILISKEYQSKCDTILLHPWLNWRCIHWDFLHVIQANYIESGTWALVFVKFHLLFNFKFAWRMNTSTLILKDFNTVFMHYNKIPNSKYNWMHHIQTETRVN